MLTYLLISVKSSGHDSAEDVKGCRVLRRVLLRNVNHQPAILLIKQRWLRPVSKATHGDLGNYVQWGLQYRIQWGSENRTCPVLKWCLVIEWFWLA